MGKRSFGALIALTLAAAGLIASNKASGAPFYGTFGPTIYGLKADLNGDGIVNGVDDSIEFFGDTTIIDGQLDCDAWPGVNQDAHGDNTIDTDDDCTLLAYDGTTDGVTIEVVNGAFALKDNVPIANGTPLPTIYPNPGTPMDADIGNSRFAWSTINGRVDTNGDEVIDDDDCSRDLIGIIDDVGVGADHQGVNVLSGATNPCEFAGPLGTPAGGDRGLVDLNGDQNITTTDTCTTGCFFGHNVTEGVVQAEGSATATPTPTPTTTPTPSPTPTGGSPSPSPTPVVPALQVTNAGAATVASDCQFVVSLTRAVTNLVTVDFATSGAERQIVTAAGTLRFAPGETSKSVVVDVIKQKRFRTSFELVLSNASGAPITDGSGRCGIKRRARGARRVV